MEVNPLFEALAWREGFHSEELMKKIAQDGNVQKLEEIPEKVRQLFVTAHDISPEDHIQMQSAFQRHTDNPVLKTVNFPQDASVDEVAKVYERAYELGCKGVTIYRDRSRAVQVLYQGVTETAQEKPKAELALAVVERRPKAREDVIHGSTRKIRTGCGNLYVTVNEDEDFAGLLSGAAFLTKVSSWSENPEAPQDLGHFFLLVDAARLGPPEWLAGRMREFASNIHDTPPADPASPVLLPGEIELDRLERHRRDGFALDAAIAAGLEALASRKSPD